MSAVQEKRLTVEEALSGNYGPLIDVRSEGEFEEASIPGALNISLLSDSERAMVGTVYRHEGPEAARRLGLEIASPKLPDIYNKIESTVGKGPAVLFCWRGGMRSKTMATILSLLGLDVYRLEGGYKAFRRYVNEYLEKVTGAKDLVLLHGNTGVGKTDILSALEQKGIGIVDLESLAENRGSVFGNIGYSHIPSQQSFEGRLVMALSKSSNKPCIVAECESRRIGRLVLPQPFYSWMQAGRHIHVYASTSARVERLVNNYAREGNVSDLLQAMGRLEQRLGKTRVSDLSRLIGEGNYAVVAEVLLREYYDPLYRYPNGPSQLYDLSVDSSSIDEASEVIVAYLNSRYLN